MLLTGPAYSYAVDRPSIQLYTIMCGVMCVCVCVCVCAGLLLLLLFPTQFHRVLSELELGGLMSAMEFGIIYRKFGVQVGGRNDVNYNSFCGMIEEYAQTRWTDPALK